MRVVHVTRFFHPHVGGTENFIAALAAALEPLGVESSVLCTSRYADEAGPAPALPVTRIRTLGPDIAPIWPLSRGRAAALGDADIVHLHDVRLLPWVAAFRRPSRPLVISSHGFIFHNRPRSRLKRLAWSTYFRAAARGAAVVHCVSERDRSYIASFPDDRVVVIPPAVDTSMFRAVVPLEAAAQSEAVSLLYFGRIAPNKGLDTLAPLLEANPSWTLSIVGTGDAGYVDALRSRLPNDRVEWMGTLPGPDLLQELARHDCVVLPSIEEGFGITLVEALASGRPVVASDIPTYRVIVDGSGIPLVDFRDARTARGAILAARATWDANAARALTERYAWDRLTPQFMALYRSVLST